MRELLSKLTRDPVGAVSRGLYKIFVAPRRYGRRQGYDASRYWRDRFVRHEGALRGAGDEGLSEKENEAAYAEAARVFADLCRRESLELETARVLEIGPGTGYYTELLRQLGVRSYVGLDITDVLFPELRRRFPEYRFEQGDVTTDPIEGEYDVIVMIDVIEHIVEESRLGAAVENVKAALADDGVFIVAPLTARGKRKIFYVRLWSLDDLRERFAGYRIGEPEPFRIGSIVAIRKQAAPHAVSS